MKEFQVNMKGHAVTMDSEQMREHYDCVMQFDEFHDAYVSAWVLLNELEVGEDWFDYDGNLTITRTK